MKKNGINDNHFSRNGMERRQRCVVKIQMVDAVMSYGDRVEYDRNGSMQISFSNAGLTGLVNEGAIDRQMAEKVRNLAVVVANDNVDAKSVVFRHSRRKRKRNTDY